ncbi:hypothetical protein B1526_0901 [Bifidobacterium criceti]|uniref:Uncharacterized protein n=1 Tax=Bifidobacterium criceti TaxID=1960969 RepID=A0A2A2EG72_9BIFI|nr:hypothetical protein B1526_0901 [Bifidobacterium criceti]
MTRRQQRWRVPFPLSSLLVAILTCHGTKDVDDMR